MYEYEQLHGGILISKIKVILLVTKGGIVFSSVCLCVCVCQHDYS